MDGPGDTAFHFPWVMTDCSVPSSSVASSTGECRAESELNESSQLTGCALWRSHPGARAVSFLVRRSSKAGLPSRLLQSCYCGCGASFNDSFTEKFGSLRDKGASS